MFYVCFIVSAKRNCIFPANWLKGHRKHLQNYINRSLNKNQTLIGYYSNDKLCQIESGISQLQFPPNYRLSMEVDFPADGCYFVEPKRYFGKCELRSSKWIFITHLILMFTTDRFGDAKAFLANHRNIDPPVYNERRLKETPVPSVFQEDESDSSEELDYDMLRYDSSETECELETVIDNSTVQLEGNSSINANASGKI